MKFKSISFLFYLFLSSLVLAQTDLKNAVVSGTLSVKGSGAIVATTLTGTITGAQVSGLGTSSTANMTAFDLSGTAATQITSALSTLASSGSSRYAGLSGTATMSGSAVLAGTALMSGSSTVSGTAAISGTTTDGRVATALQSITGQSGSNVTISNGTNISPFWSGTATLPSVSGTLQHVAFSPCLDISQFDQVTQTPGQYSKGLLTAQLSVSGSNFNSSTSFPAEAAGVEMDYYSTSGSDGTMSGNGSGLPSAFISAIFTYGTYGAVGIPVSCFAVNTTRTQQITGSQEIDGFRTHMGNQSTQSSGTTTLSTCVSFHATAPDISATQRISNSIGLLIDSLASPYASYGTAISQTGTADNSNFYGMMSLLGETDIYKTEIIKSGASLSISGTLIDINSSAGTNNQVLASTGSTAKWISASVLAGTTSTTLAAGNDSRFLSSSNLLPFTAMVNYLNVAALTATSTIGAGGATYSVPWYCAMGTTGTGSVTEWNVPVPVGSLSDCVSTPPVGKGLPWSRNLYCRFLFNMYASASGTASTSVMRSFCGQATAAWLPQNPSAGLEFRYPGSNQVAVVAFTNTGSISYSGTLFTITNNAASTNVFPITCNWSAGTYSVIYSGTTYATGLTSPVSDNGYSSQDYIVTEGISNDAIMTSGQQCIPGMMTSY